MISGWGFIARHRFVEESLCFVSKKSIRSQCEQRRRRTKQLEDSRLYMTFQASSNKHTHTHTVIRGQNSRWSTSRSHITTRVQFYMQKPASFKWTKDPKIRADQCSRKWTQKWSDQCSRNGPKSGADQCSRNGPKSGADQCSRMDPKVEPINAHGMDPLMTSIVRSSWH